MNLKTGLLIFSVFFILSAKSQVSESLDFNEKKAEYLYQPLFVGRRWQGVDPAKDAQAHETMLQLKLTSRKRILAEQGVDIEELDEEINSDTTAPPQPKQAVTQPEQAEPDDEDDQENAQQQPERRFDLNGYGH